LHGSIPLSQRLCHLGISATYCPGNQPDDDISRDPPPATGHLRPTVHPAVEHRRHVGGVGQGAPGDQLGYGCLDVEAGSRYSSKNTRRPASRCTSAELKVEVAADSRAGRIIGRDDTGTSRDRLLDDDLTRELATTHSGRGLDLR
jgi:hypothetical protein